MESGWSLRNSFGRILLKSSGRNVWNQDWWDTFSLSQPWLKGDVITHGTVHQARYLPAGQHWTLSHADKGPLTFFKRWKGSLPFSHPSASFRAICSCCSNRFWNCKLLEQSQGSHVSTWQQAGQPEPGRSQVDISRNQSAPSLRQNTLQYPSATGTTFLHIRLNFRKIKNAWLNSIITLSIFCYKPKVACWCVCNGQAHDPHILSGTLSIISLCHHNNPVGYTGFCIHLILPTGKQEASSWSRRELEANPAPNPRSYHLQTSPGLTWSEQLTSQPDT